MRIRSALRYASSLVVAMSLVVTPASAEPLGLGDAVSRGLARSPELGQAQARSRAAEAGKDQAEREWLPKVDASAVYGWRHLENDARILTGISAEKTRPFYATIGVNQPVWDFGRRKFAARSQAGRVKSAAWDEQAAGEFGAYAIARAYLQVLAQQEVVKAAEANLVFHRDLAADVKEGVDKGAMSISEFHQASERLQIARLSLDQAKAELKMAGSELALLLGDDEVAVQVAPDPSATMPPSLDEALRLAAANDPRLHSAEAKLQSAQSNSSRVRTEYLPTVGLQGSIRTGRDFEGYRGTTRDYELLVITRWTLFDGGVTSAKVREADAMQDEARFALGEAERESSLAVRKSWIAIDNWRDRLAIQQERLSVARAVLDSYSAQFGIGRRSLLDLLDAQSAVFNASAEVSTAKHGLLLAQYGLLAQMGKLRSYLGVKDARIDPTLYGPK